jgi:UDP-GlcNAc3NAcA epimerase
MTGLMMRGIEEILINEKPDLVIVYGDTNSTLAGSLSAAKLQIPVGHVEAGLRSFNNTMPEEINRILTDRISSFLFCPTENSVSNLEKEGFRNFGSEIFFTGDVMYDAALFYSGISSLKSDIINRLGILDRPYLLCTVHRQENTSNSENLKSIISALNELGEKYEIILPLHPGTRKTILSEGIKLNFKPLDPVGYFDMLELLKNCKLVITDSGGLQKEAYFFRKFCVTMREETEWTELVKGGFNFLAGADRQKIVQFSKRNIDRIIENPGNYYGYGNAGEVIVETILKRI